MTEVSHCGIHTLLFYIVLDSHVAEDYIILLDLTNERSVRVIMEELISIGELSSIIGISIRTIRYYEEVGILNPAKTTESNYRYYGHKEIEILEIIVFLKKLGFSLQEIKMILTQDIRTSFIEVLSNRQSQLKTEFNQLLLKKEILDSFMSIITTDKAIQDSPLDIIKEMCSKRKEQMSMICNNTFPIKVVGIGNGSVNAVNALVDSGAKIDFIHIDSDKETLSRSKAYSRIQIGEKYTKGFGTGGDFLTGEKSTKEDIELIKEAIEGSDILFILTYMGGGIGSSAAAIIAKEARKMGILTVGIIVNPSIFSSQIAIINAEKGIENLKPNLDMMLDIPVESVLHLHSEVQSANQAYAELDQLIQDAVYGLVSILSSSICAAEIEDFKFMIRERGSGCIGIGKATGLNKAAIAVKQSLSSAAMSKYFSSANSIIVSIIGSNNMILSEINLITETIQEKMKPEANMIYGTVIDEELKDSITVIIVASGFNVNK